MAIVINGSGTVTGLSVGGLPDGTVDAGTVAADVATQAELDLKANIANFTSTGIDDNADATTITIDSRENVGIGVVPESDWYNGGGEVHYHILQIGASSAVGGYVDNSTYLGSNWKDDGNNKYINTDEASLYVQQAGVHRFLTAPSGSADSAITWTTGIAIYQAQSGAAADISMGERWNGDGGGKTDFQTNTNNGVLCRMSSSTTGSNQRMWFVNSNGLVGSISTNGSSTVFATSSDYRLKENVNYDWDATTKLKQLKPIRFNFIADDTTVIDGFIAHEVQEVVPEAVTGAKDAMRDEEYEVTPAVKDEDGNIVTEAVMGTRSVPDYQGIDQSKLVPLLVKTIQELEARITALEA